MNPYLKDGVRWLNPAAFAAPTARYVRQRCDATTSAGRTSGSWDLNVSKDVRFFEATRGCSSALEMFNITNRLNYETPAAGLPAGTVGQPFTDAVACTFGYMLGPLNRTVGLGAARQTQVSVRFLF